MYRIAGMFGWGKVWRIASSNAGARGWRKKVWRMPTAVLHGLLLLLL